MSPRYCRRVVARLSLSDATGRRAVRGGDGLDAFARDALWRREIRDGGGTFGETFTHQSAGAGEITLPFAAPTQPGRLVCLGAGSVRKGSQGKQTDPSLDRILYLPLVSCDGARIVRRRNAGRLPEPEFRRHQS